MVSAGRVIELSRRYLPSADAVQSRREVISPMGWCCGALVTLFEAFSDQISQLVEQVVSGACHDGQSAGCP